MNEYTAAYHAKKIHPKHYALHAVNVVFTLALAVASDIFILEYLHNKPHTVVWTDGTMSTNWVMKTLPFIPTNKVVMGALDDGRLVWRPQTQ